jgi:hypothetical protein
MARTSTSPVANGEIFDMNSVSAAYATLPMPTYVRVTNLENNKSVIVRVNNRGPYLIMPTASSMYRSRPPSCSGSTATALRPYGSNTQAPRRLKVPTTAC